MRPRATMLVLAALAACGRGGGGGAATRSADAGGASDPAAALGRAVRVAIGPDRACAVLADGRLACWGEKPAHAIDGVAGVVDVALDGATTCVRPRTGPVSCWREGEAPAPVAGSDGARDLDVDDKLCVVTAAGAVACDGVEVPGVSGAVAVTTRWGRGCAVRDDGGVACWGDEAPAFPGVTDAVDVVQLDADVTCALRRGGALTCVGDEARGLPARADQLSGYAAGDHHCARAGGSVTCAHFVDEPPTTMALGGDAVDLACTQQACCAALADGSVRCWGDNAAGLLGDGAPLEDEAPASVAGLPPIAELALGDGVSFARSRDGKLFAWGARLGGTPAEVWTDGAITHVAAGGAAAIVALAGGGVSVAGNDDGRWAVEPLADPGGAAAAVAVAGRAFCTLVDGRGMRCWYAGADDALHDLAGPEVVALSADPAAMCGLRRDGQVACALDRAYDPDDDFPGGPAPRRAEPVPGLRDAVWLALPYAGRKDGSVVRLDLDERGRWTLEPTPELRGMTGVALGTFQWSPGCGFVGAELRCWRGFHLDEQRPIPAATPWRAVAAGQDHACAVDDAGAVACWGSDDAGQLGRGRMLSSREPVRVRGLGPS